MDNLAIRVPLRPAFEGANIRTWIGFKHLTYLAEAAVLDYFRVHKYGPQRLFHECGVRLQVVDSSLSFLHLLQADDVVSAEVSHVGNGQFNVQLLLDSMGGEICACKGKLEVALLADDDSKVGGLPDEMAALVARGRHTRASVHTQPPADLLWTWTARYYYCQYSDRLQHSAYVRALEEAVDRYLFRQGISVGRLLAERHLIPVVSRAKVRTLEDVHMEEEVLTSFVVRDVFKNMAFQAEMDCYVQRPGGYVHTATASIVHGYAHSLGPNSGRLAEMDAHIVKQLMAGHA